MCDRPIPQQNLCADLAALLDVLPDEAVAPWLVGFWDVMSREWTTGIDVLRMEKFLLLVRRVFAASLAWCRGGGGGGGGEEGKGKGKKARAAAEKRRVDMLQVFRDWPFDVTGDLARVPVGLRLHVLDLWVDEAEKVGMVGEESTEADAEFLGRIREIVGVQAQKSPSKGVKARARDGLADERLPWNQGGEGSGAEGDEDADGDEEMKNTKDGEENWGGFDD